MATQEADDALTVLQQRDSKQVVQAKQFINDLNTPSMKFGDLPTSMLLHFSNSTELYQPVLNTHGYQSLSAAALMSLVPTLPRSKLSLVVQQLVKRTVKANRVAASPASSVYGPILTGQYRMVDPTSRQSLLLTFDGSSNAVSFDGFNGPSQRHDSTYPPSWSWTDTSKGKTFNIAFTTDLNPSGFLTQTSISGTVKSSGSDLPAKLTGIHLPFDPSFLTSGSNVTLSTLGCGIPNLAMGVAWMALHAAADSTAAPALSSRATAALKRQLTVAQKGKHAFEDKIEQIDGTIIQQQLNLDVMIEDPAFWNQTEQAVRHSVNQSISNLDSRDRSMIDRLEGFMFVGPITTPYINTGSFVDGPGAEVQTKALQSTPRTISTYIANHYHPTATLMSQVLLGQRWSRIIEQSTFDAEAQRLSQTKSLNVFVRSTISAELLRNNLAVMTAAVEGLKLRIQSLNTQLQQYMDEITYVDTSIKQLEGDIASLTSRLNTGDRARIQQQLNLERSAIASLRKTYILLLSLQSSGQNELQQVASQTQRRDQDLKLRQTQLDRAVGNARLAQQSMSDL
ncbi:hypothetical protein ANO11243_061900 [Dothideomycetidae sp. 11243]|nr:hypothetical protein ANO11243_061900 [fungal sp. No.11243]